MDDFRDQLRRVCDEMLAEGVTPVVLIMDLAGASYIKRARDAESLGNFHDSVIAALTGAARGGDGFAYGEERVVGILPGFDRLKTFALIEKLRRSLPLVAQSYDCYLQPEFDTLEYDAKSGLAPIVAAITRPREQEHAA